VRVAVWLLLLASCARDPSELGPVQALTSFLAAVEQSANSPEQRKVAFGWLDSETQAALEERAELSSSLAGRDIEAWELLVPGRVSFAGQSVAGVRMKASVSGDRATVQIPVEKRAPVEVAMVREEGRWRVMLGLKPTTSE